MPSRDWLTQEELLGELLQAGITVSERTLRFWVTNQVLPSPVRKPYRGADGRVGFYPRESLTLVPKILALQAEGWKLRQIKQRLEAPAEVRQQRTATSSEGAEEWAGRFLQDLLSDTEARDRRRCFHSPAAAASDLRQVRHFLVARLERLVGRSAAVRATSAFLLSLQPKELKRLISRLKVSSSARLDRLQSPDQSSLQTLGQQLERLDRSTLKEGVSQHTDRLNRIDEPAPPLILPRAKVALAGLSQALAEESPEAVVRQLALLLEIEREAEANLAFLEQTSRKS